MPECELSAAVAGGIAQADAGTALHHAPTGAIREHLTAHPEAADARRGPRAGREAVARAVGPKDAGAGVTPA
ncbi:hypothetical protein C6376_38015 [Streptomyces sp. P3]|uniref:hypothetical protein n=1 Tax=Streptomyces sp. P3 TaxID=2135430 RepID=UPI000D1BA59F|nr:hypothetical protein C6376_38015 [Streptomyces sp. P3]